MWIKSSSVQKTHLLCVPTTSCLIIAAARCSKGKQILCTYQCQNEQIQNYLILKLTNENLNQNLSENIIVIVQNNTCMMTG